MKAVFRVIGSEDYISKLPHSYEGTLSKMVRMLLEMKGAKLLIGVDRGWRALS